MSDPVQHGAAKLQSSAMVVAAFITTLGAITAACIQTGWISKPPAGTIVQAPARVAPAAFLGTIEPYADKAGDVPQADVGSVAPQPIENELGGNDLRGSVLPSGLLPSSGGKAPLLPAQAWPGQTASPATLHQSTTQPNSLQSGVLSRGVIQPDALVVRLDKAPASGVMQQASFNVAAPSVAAASPLGTDSLPPPPSFSGSETRQMAGYSPAAARETTLLADDAAVKILPSPWSFLTQPSGSDVPDAPKAAKKLDWGAVTRFFTGHE